MHKTIKFELEVTECPCCNKLMMVKANRGVFPGWFKNDQDAQIKTAGIVYRSEAKIDNKYICTECKDNGKSSFVCYLCNERRDSKMIKDSFGDEPTYLCKVCYASVSAKKWNETVDKLQEIHKYDFY